LATLCPTLAPPLPPILLLLFLPSITLHLSLATHTTPHPAAQATLHSPLASPLSSHSPPPPPTRIYYNDLPHTLELLSGAPAPAPAPLSLSLGCLLKGGASIERLVRKGGDDFFPGPNLIRLLLTMFILLACSPPSSPTNDDLPCKPSEPQNIVLVSDRVQSQPRGVGGRTVPCGCTE
jgi:hypothetical protein